MSLNFIILSMIKYIFLFSILFFSPTASGFEVDVVKNEMTANISLEQNEVIIDLTAPKKGWFMIGLDRDNNLQNARLFFVRIINNEMEVEEHRTDFSYPAPYHKMTLYNSKLIEKSFFNSSPEENRAVFKIPLQGEFPDQVNLEVSQTIYVILAYSNENDFDHHSAMRTSIKANWERAR